MTRIAAIHQPNFFPWLGFFYKMAKSDVFILLDTVDITLGGAKAITHRTRIKTANGPVWLTIPLLKSDSKKIKDIKIDYRTPWKEKHLKTIYFSYKKAGCFDDIFGKLEKFYDSKFEFLSEFTSLSVNFVKDYLEIKTTVKKASELGIVTEERNQRIIEICRAVGANAYLSGFGGRKYHREDIFTNNGLLLNYSDFKHPEYVQAKGAFISGLSVLDALMHLGKSTRDLILKNPD